MCGIVAACANRHVEQILLEGLKRLEYRGYDSAGLALCDDAADIKTIKVLGKVSGLVEQVAAKASSGLSGIAHTRWATHGEPAEHNAHPHSSSDGQITLVHNGIIENHNQLRAELKTAGFSFSSTTDSEVIAALIAHESRRQQDFRSAVAAALPKLNGAYALAICCASSPGVVLGVRKASPLVIGLGIEENYLSSDPLALAGLTEKFIYLQEGEIAQIDRLSARLFDQNGREQSLSKRVQIVSQIIENLDKGGHRHYMHKEIFAQPQVLAASLEGRLSSEKILVDSLGYGLSTNLAQIEHIQICACGTSMHAGLTAKYWLEQLAGVPTQVEVASEYRYRDIAIANNSLYLTISQSGETADSLAALEFKGTQFPWQLAICNVANSSMMRSCTYNLQTFAGREIGVASTKAYLAQLSVLLYFCLALAKARGRLTNTQEQYLIKQILNLSETITAVLALEEQIIECAHKLQHYKNALFLGRGLNFPLALESALKLKEIAYIHSEAYPGGELKHGPLALIDTSMPCIAFTSADANTSNKLLSNLAEVKARDGIVFLFHDKRLHPDDQLIDMSVALPVVDPILAPIAYAPAGQLLAYHCALLLGTDIDQPRNLAKSVTVE